MRPPLTPACRRCGALLEDVEWIDISTFGDLEPSYVMGRSRCPTEGCGTTCPICRRPPGDIHSGACAPFVLGKLTDPCRVTREDCGMAPERKPPPADTSWIKMTKIR